MPRSAVRSDPRIVAAVVRMDDGRMPFAEINRRVGAVAELIGVPRPSYEQVRLLVHEVRRARRHPGVGQVLLEVAFQARPVGAVLDALAGTPVRKF